MHQAQKRSRGFALLASEETEHIKVFMGLHRLISGSEPSNREGYDPEFEESISVP